MRPGSLSPSPAWRSGASRSPWLPRRADVWDDCSMRIAIRDADLLDAGDARALVEIIDSYAREAGGQSAPLSEQARTALAPGLHAHPAAFALLAWQDGVAVGAAVCVWGFSTFSGCPSLNVHDLAVSPGHRGRGIGQRLLEEVERRARARGS